jgi:hypothetical protein
MTFDPNFGNDPNFGRRPTPEIDPRFGPADGRYSSPMAALGFLFGLVAIMVGASFFFSNSASRTETASVQQPASPGVTAPITQPKPAETTGSGTSSQ